ncbi:uncharacterized protein METZ01_LOCUS5346, partial [marine metagenome]
VILGEKPFFCDSPLVFTSIKHSVFLFIFFEPLFILVASLNESTLSMVSKRFKHLLTLFVCRWPINRFLIFSKPGK